MNAIIEKLRACAEDPMFSDHAEVSKATLRAAIALLECSTLDASDERMRAMVSRFLGWPLPQTFSPDCYISFDRERANAVSWPIGTNLFTATEAQQMLEHVLAKPADEGGTLENHCPGCGDSSGWNGGVRCALCNSDGSKSMPAGAQPWDASHIKQPGWHHVEAAFIEGAREARANPEADEAMFRRAADGYTKRVFEEVDPTSEAALRTESWRDPDTGRTTPKPQPCGVEQARAALGVTRLDVETVCTKDANASPGGGE